ncbi:hypothetical protein [Frigoriglobus tundricola]|uniref:Uncharacterized protein n=1 Tax=Frigoriglobus tundricola TaxID=2774151 RepID=A0A6M5YV10_9BACT|nr:hypothetical protein [Frigoriglobus tundricola]QJW97937.1 hypothetical protein FTUN_5517 [Frigoriglobus tundricola]
MRHRYIWGTVLAAIAAVGLPAPVSAQEGGFPVPLNSDPTIPIPTGQAGQPGFYASVEYVMLMQTKAIGNETIAIRGFYDSSGTLTGTPGQFIGSGRPALTANQIGGPYTLQPGYRLEIGYKFDTGVRIYANYMNTFRANYSSGASAVPQGFNTGQNLADSFLSSPVYNFNAAFNGPQFKTAADTTANGGFQTVGIWNGASQMDTKFSASYTQADLGLRSPMFATDYSSIYALAGARYAWFYDKFYWLTQDYDNVGNQSPAYTAKYTNNLSQRMYGLFVGAGHEVYLGNMFSASLDVTGAAFLDVEKMRAKYEGGGSGDGTIGNGGVQSKYGRLSYAVVPSATAELNMWFYPVEGVQMRLGYMGMSYFNTQYMKNPVGFNYGNIDPGYATKVFRLVHGFNVGIGFFF